MISVFYISNHNLLFKHPEHYNHCISILLGCIRNISFFFAFKAAVVLLIGSFCSANPPLILISSWGPWCSHQPMNEVQKELDPPPYLLLMYILLISCHINFQRNSSSVGIPSQNNPQQTKQRRIKNLLTSEMEVKNLIKYDISFLYQ